MRKYEVRLEFTVQESEFLDIEVDADSREEAIKKAIEKYENDDHDDGYYSGDYTESTLDRHTQQNWNVEEKE